MLVPTFVLRQCCFSDVFHLFYNRYVTATYCKHTMYVEFLIEVVCAHDRIYYLTHWGWDNMAAISRLHFHVHFLEWKHETNMATMLEIMTWCLTGDKLLSEAMIVCFTDTYICVTCPQYIKTNVIVWYWWHIITDQSIRSPIFFPYYWYDVCHILPCQNSRYQFQSMSVSALLLSATMWCVPISERHLLCFYEFVSFEITKHLVFSK